MESSDTVLNKGIPRSTIGRCDAGHIDKNAATSGPLVPCEPPIERIREPIDNSSAMSLIFAGGLLPQPERVGARGLHR